MSQLDRFTLDLLGNDEVLDVTLDPLGKAAGRIWAEERLEVWGRRLSDGSAAAGLFNRGLRPAQVTVRFPDLGVSGRQHVRDLWQRKDLGAFDGAFTATVPAHGAVMVRIGRGRPATP
jgi:alpha-galactosidase